MRAFPLLFPALIALALALPLRAVQLKLDSPDKNSTWAYGEISDRELRWNQKKQVLVAVVTFSNSLHAGAGESQETDELTFTFPGTFLNPDDHTVYVNGPDGQPIPVGLWRKGTFGSRLDLFQSSMIMVHKYKTEITLTLDIDTQRTIEKEKQKEQGEETESFSLDGLIHKKE